MVKRVLGDEEDVLVVLEGLVELDAGGVVERLQDFDLIEEEFWLLDVLLGDFLDGPPVGAALLLSLVDHSVCALAEFLRGAAGTLGAMS